MWRWEHPRDERITRLFCGDRLMLVIDETRLVICDRVGPKEERLNTIVGNGIRPLPEDERLILSLLNKKGD